MRCVLILLLLAGAALGQPSFSVLVGKAASVAGDQLVVQTGGASILLYADQNSEVWRGKTGHSLSPVQPGDDVILRYRKDAAGRLVIIDLHANMTHIFGRILRVAGGSFEVDQNYNADPRSAYVRQNRVIAFDSDTTFEESAPDDLKPGRDVDIIGLKTGGSRVQATRITIYEGRAPVRMKPGTRVILPNGTIRELQ